jgi:hypothetical protein
VALLNPLLFFVVSIGFFLVLLYRKIGVGIALTVSAFLMSILSFGVWETGTVLLETCVDVTTLSLVFASFFIMLMSTLYKETGLVNSLTKSLSGFIKNSKSSSAFFPRYRFDACCWWGFDVCSDCGRRGRQTGAG